MKRIFIIVGVVSLLSVAAVAAERSMLARVTVYWASGGSGSDRWTRNHQAATSVRLREGHCAVDPRRIPYGSKVIFPDGTLTAVDTGSQVKSRRAARRLGRSSAQRGAIVIDRFFETKQQALAWAKKNPHFMKVRVVSTSRVKDLVTGAETRTTSTTTTTKVAANKPAQPAAVASPTVAKPAVAPNPVPSVAAVAKADTAAPRPIALRTSVPTARTPAPAAAVARPQTLAVASAAPATAANAKPASRAPAAAPPATRLAANSSELPTVLDATNGVMIHGPSHYRRAVAYMP